MTITNKPVSLLLANQSQETKFVIATGVGEDVASALQDAARQALINTVGSFIESQTSLRSNSLQRDNEIIKRTKEIEKNINEFSQGSILSINTLNIENIGRLKKVTARVQIKMEPLRILIKKQENAQLEVDKGLFATITTNQKNYATRTNIVLERIINPIKHGEQLKVEFLKPATAVEIANSSLCKNNKPQPEVLNLCNEARRSTLNTIFVPFKLSLDPKFRTMMHTLLERASQQKADSTFHRKAKINHDRKGMLSKLQKKFNDFSNQNGDLILGELDLSSAKITAYHLPRFLSLIKFDPAQTGCHINSQCVATKFSVVFIDKNGNNIRSYTFHPKNWKSNDDLASLELFSLQQINIYQYNDRALAAIRYIDNNPDTALIIPERDYVLKIEADQRLLGLTNSLDIRFGKKTY